MKKSSVQEKKERPGGEKGELMGTCELGFPRGLIFAVGGGGVRGAEGRRRPSSQPCHVRLKVLPMLPTKTSPKPLLNEGKGVAIKFIVGGFSGESGLTWEIVGESLGRRWNSLKGEGKGHVTYRRKGRQKKYLYLRSKTNTKRVSLSRKHDLLLSPLFGQCRRKQVRGGGLDTYVDAKVVVKDITKEGHSKKLMALGARVRRSM